MPVSLLCQQKNIITITDLFGRLPLEESLTLIKKEMSKSSASLSSGARAKKNVNQILTGGLVTVAGPSLVAKTSSSGHVNVTNISFTGAGAGHL